MAMIAIVLTAAVVGLGLLGLVSPSRLLSLVRRLQNRSGIYAATVMRLALGSALFVAAGGSRAPGILQVVGIALVVAGLLTPLVGLERFRRLLEFWSGRGTGLIRATAAITAAVGLYLIYALAA